MTTASGGYAAGDGFYIAHWGGNNGTYIYNKENAPLYFGTNAAERFRIGDSSNGGDVTITDGNLVLANGHGIDFSFDGNNSGMSSELLDDYEEGTWTPTVTQGTVSSANCSYTKIGRVVVLQGKIDQFSNNSNSAGVQIGNLPFSASVTNVAVGSVMYKYVGVQHATVLYITSNSLLEMYGGSSGDWSYITYNGLNVSSGATAMYFIATYQAS